MLQEVQYLKGRVSWLYSHRRTKSYRSLLLPVNSPLSVAFMMYASIIHTVYSFEFMYNWINFWVGVKGHKTWCNEMVLCHKKIVKLCLFGSLKV